MCVHKNEATCLFAIIIHKFALNLACNFRDECLAALYENFAHQLKYVSTITCTVRQNKPDNVCNEFVKHLLLKLLANFNGNL